MAKSFESFLKEWEKDYKKPFSNEESFGMEYKPAGSGFSLESTLDAIKSSYPSVKSFDMGTVLDAIKIPGAQAQTQTPTPTPTQAPSPTPMTFSNTFIDKPQEPNLINKFYNVVRAIEENPVVDFVSGLGATAEKTLGISALRKLIGQEDIAQGVENKATEFEQKHPLASMGTQIGSYIMPIAKGTQVLSKVPYLSKVAAPLTAAGFETAKGVLEGNSATDIATKAASSAAFMAAGGAATKALESVGAKILQSSPQALKNSIAAELTKNIFAGASGGVAGGVVARQVTNPGEMPSSKDMLYDAVLMGVMHGFNAIPGTLMQAKGVSEQLKQDSVEFARTMDYLNTKAVTETGVEKKIEYYTQMRDGIDKGLSSLYNNRFVGSNKVVENFQESLMFGRNAVEKKISDLSGLLNKALPGMGGATSQGTAGASGSMARGMMPGSSGSLPFGMGQVGLPSPSAGSMAGMGGGLANIGGVGGVPNSPMGAFVPQQSSFKRMADMLPPLSFPSQLPEPKEKQVPTTRSFVPDTNVGNMGKAGIDPFDEIFGLGSPANTESAKVINVPEIDNRTYNSVGDRNVKAIQQIKPELAPYIQGEAKRLLTELVGSQQGKRIPIKDEDGYIVGYRGEGRVTSDAIERILDNFPVKPTYKEIQVALEKIVKDGGAENNALSKRIELIIDDNLSMGTRDINGIDLPANEGYVNAKVGINQIPDAGKMVAPADSQEVVKKSETFRKEDIPYNLAYNAFRGMSHSPERRAESEQNFYTETMQNVYKKYSEMAKTPEQKQAFEAEFERFKNTFLKYRKAFLNAHNGYYTVNIAGRSKFPVSKMEKKWNSIVNRGKEFNDAIDKAERRLSKAISVNKSEDIRKNEIADNLKKEVEEVVATLKGIERGQPYNPALFRSSLQGKLKRAADNGHVEAVKQALEHIKDVEAKAQLKKPVFAPNNMIWQYVEKKVVETNKTEGQKSGQSNIVESDKVKIVKNLDLDRIQIVFDGKPTSEIIKDLKGAGWNWSPSNKAWQRKLTPNAEASAKRIVDKYYPETKNVPQSPMENIDKKEYNENREQMQNELTKIFPEYTQSVEGRKDLETAIESIQDLQKLEASRETGKEKGDNLPSDGRALGRDRSFRSRTLGNAISVKAIKTGKVKIKGAKIYNEYDLAEIAQVFRDPRFETMRYIFVKNNVVVHYEGVSSFVAGVCQVNPYSKPYSEYKKLSKEGQESGFLQAERDFMDADNEKWFKELNEIMKKHKADGYYLLHNHPSGHVKASQSDAQATEKIRKNVPGFISHVILDSNKYFILERDKNGSYKGTFQEAEFHKEDPILKPSKEHPLLGKLMSSTSKLGEIALQMKNSKKYVTVIHVNNQNEIVGIQEVPDDMVKDSQYLKEFLKPKNMEFGSAKAFLVTKNPDIYTNLDKSLVTDGFILDMAYIDKNNQVKSYRYENQGVNEKPNWWMGKNVDDYPSMKVKEEKERYNKRPFFSKLQQVLKAKMPNRADKDLVYNLISKNGVKQEEIKWSGINDFMKGKERVGKQELLEFLKMNELQIEEIIKKQNYKYEAYIFGELQSFDTKKDAEDAINNAISYAKDSYMRIEYDTNDSNDIGLIDDNGDYVEKYIWDEENKLYISTENDAEISNIDEVFEVLEELKSKEVKSMLNDISKEPKRIEVEGGGGKYQDYQLPHGENYRELLFQLPTKTITDKNITELMPHGLNIIEMDRWIDKYESEQVKYQSSHWDEPNVLAHVRLNDRVDAQGNKVLFIEEIQSDWHQEGRKNMYKSEYEALKKPFVDFLESKGLKIPSDSISSLSLRNAGASEEMLSQFSTFQSKVKGIPVPDAPFQKTWHEFVLKRMIRYAAENGYDKIAWTTGDIQNKRYDLSKQIDNITVTPWIGETGMKLFDVKIDDKNNRRVLSNDGMTKKELSDYIGEELANKIDNLDVEKETRLEGVDLEIGGSGMKGFYDKIIPDFLNQYGKRWQAKVSDTEIDIEKGKGSVRTYIGAELSLQELRDIRKNNYEKLFNDDLRLVIELDSIINDMEQNRTTFIQAVEKYSGDKLAKILGGQLKRYNGVKVQSFPITESMKDSVLTEGQALFEEKPGYKVDKNGKDKTDPLTSQLDMELPPASGQNTSGKARRASEIIKDFEKRFLNKVRVGKINGANVLGYFQIPTHVIRLRKANDIPTFTHEAGHLIDKLYRLSKVDTMTQSGIDVGKVRDELLRIGKHTTRSKDDMKLRKEGIAEFTRLFLTDQPQAFSRAPETFEYFKKVIDPDLMGFLNERMQDIWDLVNLTPEDRVMRDVWNKEEVDKARRKAEGLRLKLEQFYTQTVDEYFPAIKDAKLLAGEEGEKRIKQLVAQNRGYESSAMFSINPKGIDGMYQSDLYGKKVGPSLFEILEPLANDTKKQDYFWKAYAIARRAEDYHARKLDLPNDIETYRQTVKNLEIKYPDFSEIFKKVRHYDDNLLNLLRQAGFFSKEQVKKIMEDNPNHIHLFRVMDDGIVSPKSTKGNPVKSLKGGGQEILNPYESMVNMTFVIWGAAKRQQLLLELADMSNKAEGMGAVMVKSPYEFKITEFNLDEVKKQIINSLLQQGVNLDEFYKGFDIDLEFDTMVKVFRPNFFAKGNQLAIYRDGKIELYDVEPELYKSLSGMNPVTFNATMKTVMNVLMKVGDFQAASILYTPRFVAWNTTREVLTSWLQTRAGISMFDIVKGAISVARHDPWFLEAVKRGGTTEMFLANEARFVNDVIKELSLGRSTAKRMFNNLRHPLNTIREVIQFTELGTKTAEAKKTIENRMIRRFADSIGKGEFVTRVLKWIDPRIRRQWKDFFEITNTSAAEWDEAIFNMRDLTYDIKRKGKTVRELNVNRIWRFFNSYVQGMDQAVRATKDPERNKRLLIRGIMLALFSLYINYLVENNENYKNLKPYQKDNFWNIPIGNPATTKIFLPIPRGFEWAIPFMALPVRMKDYFYNDNPEAWKGFGTSLINNFTYEFMPMAVRPFIEQATNTTWQGIPIENYGDRLVSAKYRYDDRTSEMAKGIAEVTNKLPFEVDAIQSPKRIEHLIRGFTGTTGGVAISAIDEMAGKSNYKASDLLKDMPYLNAIKDVPGVNTVIGSFFVDAERSNTIRDDYYKGNEEATKKYNDLKKSGEVSMDSVEGLVLNKLYNKFDSGIEKLKKVKKVLEKNRTEESREQIKKIDSSILQMQKDMLQIEKKMKEAMKNK